MKYGLILYKIFDLLKFNFRHTCTCWKVSQATKTKQPYGIETWIYLKELPNISPSTIIGNFQPLNKR